MLVFSNLPITLLGMLSRACLIAFDAHRREHVWLGHLTISCVCDGTACFSDAVRILSESFLVLCCRMYAQRRVRDSFKESRGLSEHSEIERLYHKGLDTLALLRRQV